MNHPTLCVLIGKCKLSGRRNFFLHKAPPCFTKDSPRSPWGKDRAEWYKDCLTGKQIYPSRNNLGSGRELSRDLRDIASSNREIRRPNREKPRLHSENVGHGRKTHCLRREIRCQLTKNRPPQARESMDQGGKPGSQTREAKSQSREPKFAPREALSRTREPVSRSQNALTRARNQRSPSKNRLSHPKNHHAPWEKSAVPVDQWQTPPEESATPRKKSPTPVDKSPTPRKKPSDKWLGGGGVV